MLKDRVFYSGIDQTRQMCLMYWIIPLIAGVVAGQEIREIPRLRPYLEVGLAKMIRFAKELSTEAQAKSGTSGNAEK